MDIRTVSYVSLYAIAVPWSLNIFQNPSRSLYCIDMDH